MGRPENAQALGGWGGNTFGPKFGACQAVSPQTANPYRTAVAANFFTMASNSLRSLSFRFDE